MRSRGLLLTIALVGLVAQGLIHRMVVYPRWQQDYKPPTEGIVTGLDPNQLFVALTGFRELIAGILWVRADSFFDTGNYDAILPVIRLVTWLDPHQLDVFATGMWHIGYNFTDEENRSDRRYIPSALALGKRGVKYNAQTYELFFELGWMYYHKIEDDFEEAVYWFKEAHKRPDMLNARKNLLTNALERAGKVEEALATNFRLLAEAEDRFKKDPAYGNRTLRDTIELKADNHLARMVQRGYFAAERGDSIEAYDVYPPFDVGFSARATVIAPRVVMCEGSWNVRPVGTRIRTILRDKDFPHAVPAGMEWGHAEDVFLDPPSDTTYMQDLLFVKNRRFRRTIDMSKDITMYPFKGEEYVVEFYYNPRNAPPHIQDKFGWNGEGMTDKNYLSTEARPGQKVVYVQLRLTRDQILMRGEWADRNASVQTPNFKPPGETDIDEEVIKVPGLTAPGSG